MALVSLEMMGAFAGKAHAHEKVTGSNYSRGVICQYEFAAGLQEGWSMMHRCPHTQLLVGWFCR